MRFSDHVRRFTPLVIAALPLLGQLGDNLAWLARNDLEAERKLDMADKAAQDALLADVTGEVETLIPLVTNLIADDQTQKDRDKVLQDQIDALTANGGDPATIATLQDLKDKLAPVLAQLVPMATPPPSVPENPDTGGATPGTPGATTVATEDASGNTVTTATNDGSGTTPGVPALQVTTTAPSGALVSQVSTTDNPDGSQTLVTENGDGTMTTDTVPAPLAPAPNVPATGATALPPASGDAPAGSDAAAVSNGSTAPVTST